MELHDSNHHHHLVGGFPQQPHAMAEPKSEFDPAQGHLQMGHFGGPPPPPPLDTRRPLPKFEGQDHHHHGGVAPPPLPPPPPVRKRTKLSCDYCKTRRCKCQRLDQPPHASGSGSSTSRMDINTGADDEGLTPCKLCIEAGIQCVTTMPRKHRIYGSVEGLDRRYRAIDALIRGLHPQLGAEPTAEEVIAYGRELGLEMPDFDGSGGGGGGGGSSSVGEPPTPQSVTTAKRPRSVSASALLSPVSPENKTTRSDRSDESSANLVRDPSGRPHYIGPAGSLAFFTRLRNLVATRSQSWSSELSSDPHPEHLTADLMADPTMVYDHTTQQQRRQSNHHDRLLRPPLSPSMFRGDSPTTSFSFSGPEAHANPSELLRHCVPSTKVKFPEREVADRYVEAFFQHMHPNFVIFHRPTFQHVYEEIWRAASLEHHQHEGSSNDKESGAAPAPDTNQPQTYVSVGWLGCLYMIFIFGCRSLPQNNQTLDFQRRYYAEMTGLPQLLVTLSLPNVCALMLLSLHSNNTNDRTAAWTYHGAACRLAVALGMHRQDVSGSFHPITRELRKRVWWTLYCYEQNLCCSLGRPSAIDDREVDVDYPDEQVLAPAPGQPWGLAEQLAKLWHLVGCIRRDVYDLDHCPASRYRQAVQYLHRLVSWRSALPPDLQPTPYSASSASSPDRQHHEDLTSWRSILILHIVYQCALGLLSRRFLLREVEASEQGVDLGATPDGFVVTQLSRVCVTSAMRAVGLFVELWRGGAFNAICWFDVYWVYLTSMELTLRLVAPDAAMPPPPAPDPRSQAGGGGGSSQHQRTSSSSTDPHRHSSPPPLSDEAAAQHTWKFQPLPTHQQQEAQHSVHSGSRTELGRELDALLSQNQLTETHSVAELADAVRRLHDILKTVEMSGTNARFAKIANEFAKAMKLVDGRPTSTLFGNQLGSELEGVRAGENPATLRQMGHAHEADQQQQRLSVGAGVGIPPSEGDSGLPPPPPRPPHLQQQQDQQQQQQQAQQQQQQHDHQQQQQQQPSPMDPSHHHPLGPTGWHNLPQQPAHVHQPLGAPIFNPDGRHPSVSGIDFVYSGVFNPATTATATNPTGSASEVPATSAAPDIQWDMVLAPEQWEQSQNLLTDMTDLSYPTWAFMGGGGGGGGNMYPYMNMGPSGG
ncbi:hypothetical protein PG991_010275 [Apiospora marii]|uniref:Xylanolytic transcriptional activator regulatory domain-containing protein n=1 Tax=Apiospora marii TaxID=335849 RepID=A0ABR1RI16_9PEZI